MIESVEDSNAIDNQLYRLLISHILVDSIIGLSKYRLVKITSTYDSRTFSSMGYTLVEGRRCKKDSVKVKVDPPR